MLNRILICFTLLFGLLAEATAMHIIGGELTYEFIESVSPTTNRYKFVLTVYRDCRGGGADFDNPAHFAIYRGNISSAVRIETFQVNVGPIEPIPVDTPACVSNVPIVCAEKTTYTFFRNLEQINQSYFIIYQRCCRNNTIRNLINPGDVGATYYAEISPYAQQIKNSSPQFKTFPRTVICNGIPLFEDQSATDKDGHQLVYSFCSPITGGGTILQGPGLNSCDGAQPIPPCGPPFSQVPFLVPDFTPTAPMGGNPLITINSSTGLITGTPNQLGQFVVGVCIQEFNNGALVGSIRREFQFNLANCAPDVFANVTADTTLAPQVYVINSCGPRTVFVKNTSTKIQNISSLRWEVNLQGTTVTSTDFDLTFTFPDTGRYAAKLILNPGAACSDTAQVFINIFPGLNADFSYDYDTCIAGPVAFTDLSTSEAGINFNRFWSFGSSANTSTEPNPVYQFTTPGSKNIRLLVVDKNNCKDTLNTTILWQPAPPYVIISPDDFSGCMPAKITFENLSSPIDSTYFIVWDYGDGQRDTNIISPMHTYTAAGLYDVSVFIRSPIGCEVSDTFPRLIRVSQSPTADFSMDPDGGLTQLNNTVQFTNLSTDADRYGWKFGPVVTSTLENPTYTFPDTGLVRVLLVATNEFGCKDTISKWLDIVPLANWTMPNAFTPNGDSHNEGYIGNGFIDYAREFRMSIWNRWGELVFETTDPRQAWNGTLRNEGRPAPDGVYVYLVQYVEPRGERRELRGYLHLLR